MRKPILLVLLIISAVAYVTMLPGLFITIYADNPIEISDCIGLQAMQNNLAGDYILTDNIDCSDTINWNGGDGFIPIGGASDNFFIGTLTGSQNYVISGLFSKQVIVSVPGQVTPPVCAIAMYNGVVTTWSLPAGLFGCTSGATISNVHLTNFHIMLADSYGRAAGLIGYMNGGDVDNSSANGTIDCGPNCDNNMAYDMGAIVGYSMGGAHISYSTSDFTFTGISDGLGDVGGIIGEATGSTLVENCSSVVNFSMGTGAYEAGGIVGLLSDNSSVNNSHSSGNIETGIGVTPGDSSYANDTGGLIGHINGSAATSTVSDSYSSVNITTNGVDNDYIGGFIGYIRATQAVQISGCFSTGDVISDGGILGGGGFVGYVSGAGGAVSITESRSTGDVYGSDQLGGFIGQIYASTLTINVSDTYSRGNVYGDATYEDTDVGGYIGYVRNANISNSYSTGAPTVVLQSDYIGGFAGWRVNGSISNSYWDTQTSNIGTSPGGGTGYTTSQMKDQNNFNTWDFVNIWDIDALINDGYPYFANEIGQPTPTPESSPTPTPGSTGTPNISSLTQYRPNFTSINVGGTIPEDVVRFKADVDNQSDFILEIETRALGVSFSDVATTSGSGNSGYGWAMEENLANDSYHWQARACSYPAPTDCTSWVSFGGNAESAADFIINTPSINISNCTELQNINNNLYANYTLTDNIDCSDTINWNGGSGFVPIGQFFPGDFGGKLEGQGYVITDLYINYSSNWEVGLFGRLNTAAEIYDLGLVDASISASNGYDGAGGIAGTSFGIIDNCFVSGINLNITAVNIFYVGGVVGDMQMGFLTGSYSSGIVTSSLNYAGGVAGGVNGFDTYLVDSLHSNATVTGQDGAGGIIGSLLSPEDSQFLYDSYVDGGDITATDGPAGGIIGQLWSNINEAVYSMENIVVSNTSVASNTDYAGGIIGYVSGSNQMELTNVSFSGSIAGNDYLGGIFGYVAAIPIHASGINVEGTIDGNSNVGGVVGYFSATNTITNCNSTALVTGVSNYGDIFGQNFGYISCNGFSFGDTPTPTITPTIAVATDTPVLSPTPLSQTNTPVPTNTTAPSNTPTATSAVPTPTALSGSTVPTNTPTATGSVTPTISQTGTITPTISVTITISAQATPTVSVSYSYPTGQITPTVSSLPYTGDTQLEETIRGVYNTIAPLAPSFTVGALVSTVTVASAAAVSYPQALNYGFLWITKKKPKKPWGIVYDEGEKKPIPFAVVRILTRLEGKFIKQNITDSQGRYGFVLDKGEYVLRVDHSDYMPYSKDIGVPEEKSLTLDIGLKKTTYKKNIISDIQNDIKDNLFPVSLVITIVGLIFSILTLITSPVFINYIIAVIYGIQITILALSRDQRDWGVVLAGNNQPIRGAFVRLFDPIEGRQIDVQITDEKGRFGFITKKGEYLLQADSPGYLFSTSQGGGTVIQKARQIFLQVNTKDKINCTIALDRA